MDLQRVSRPVTPGETWKLSKGLFDDFQLYLGIWADFLTFAVDSEFSDRLLGKGEVGLEIDRCKLGMTLQGCTNLHTKAPGLFHLVVRMPKPVIMFTDEP